MKMREFWGIGGHRVSFNDQCDIFLITDQIFKLEKSRLGQMVCRQVGTVMILLEFGLWIMMVWSSLL